MPEPTAAAELSAALRIQLERVERYFDRLSDIEHDAMLDRAAERYPSLADRLDRLRRRRREP